MKDNYTDISIVLDRSESMRPLREEVVKSINAFIEEQKIVPGMATLSITQFNTSLEFTCQGKPIKCVQPLTRETYDVGGWTALLDAIAKTIINTGKRLAAMPEHERPSKVIVAIMTDGEENSSQEYGGESGRQRVFDMIKHQAERYNWQFVFLGANQDAIKSGASLGIMGQTCLDYDHSKGGLINAVRSLSHNTAMYRCAVKSDMSFSDQDREAQKQASK